MRIFERVHRDGTKRGRALKNAAAIVVRDVAGPDASGWWMPVGDGRPILIPVITKEPTRCLELTTVLHAEWQRMRPSSRELDFIVLALDNAQAVSLIVNVATPLVPPPAPRLFRGVSRLQRTQRGTIDPTKTLT